MLGIKYRGQDMVYTFGKGNNSATLFGGVYICLSSNWMKSPFNFASTYSFLWNFNLWLFLSWEEFQSFKTTPFPFKWKSNYEFNIYNHFNQFQVVFFRTLFICNTCIDLTGNMREASRLSRSYIYIYVSSCCTTSPQLRFC